MSEAINVFNALISQGTISSGLFQYLVTQKVPLDFSDLLRWQWVLSVSALDRYIHDVVRIGMIEAFQGERSQTPKFKTFRIDMKEFLNINEAPIPAIEFEKEIIRQHSFLAFQYPEKIADALAYVWDESNKWDIISSHMRTSITSNDLKVKLKNIVVRRNQIVHEGDCFSTILPLQQQMVTINDTEDVTKFITELVYAIELSIV